jgi:hypothetical protein
MDSARMEMIADRLRPHLDEVFDGFVLMGYMPDENGDHLRIIFHNGSNDAAITDGLKPALVVAKAWAGGHL